MSPIETMRLNVAAGYGRLRRSPIRSLFNLMLRLAGAFFVTETGRRDHVSDYIVFPLTLFAITSISVLCHVAWKWCDERPFLSSDPKLNRR